MAFRQIISNGYLSFDILFLALRRQFSAYTDNLFLLIFLYLVCGKIRKILRDKPDCVGRSNDRDLVKEFLADASGWQYTETLYVSEYR